MKMEKSNSNLQKKLFVSVKNMTNMINSAGTFWKIKKTNESPGKQLVEDKSYSIMQRDDESILSPLDLEKMSVSRKSSSYFQSASTSGNLNSEDNESNIFSNNGSNQDHNIKMEMNWENENSLLLPVTKKTLRSLKSNPHTCKEKKKEIKYKKRIWKRMEEIRLLELVEQFGERWHIISKFFPNCTEEELMEKYISKLNPKLHTNKFTQEEDDLLLKLHNKHGNKWNIIVQFFSKRNAIMVKNRFYSHLRKKINKSNTITSPEIEIKQNLINEKFDNSSMSLPIFISQNYDQDKNFLNNLTSKFDEENIYPKNDPFDYKESNNFNEPENFLNFSQNPSLDMDNNSFLLNSLDDNISHNQEYELPFQEIEKQIIPPVKQIQTDLTNLNNTYDSQYQVLLQKYEFMFELLNALKDIKTEKVINKEIILIDQRREILEHELCKIQKLYPYNYDKAYLIKMVDIMIEIISLIKQKITYINEKSWTN